MYYEELYEKACSGNLSALKELKSEAGVGNAEAQYILSCVYDNVTSPFCNVELGMYWLKKSAGYNYEPAIKKLKELPSNIKTLYGIDNNKEENSDRESNPENIKPGGIWSFTGRIDRTTYFVYLVVYAFIFGIILFLINLIPMERISESSGYYSYDTWQKPSFAIWTELLVSLFALYLTIALGVKRLHDCGRSGWWVILVLITAPIGPLYLLFKRGEEKTNEYGPIPE